jgi:CPA1 family monovalent cation:H+ antiporter
MRYSGEFDMHPPDLHHFELVALFLMALVVALAALARRFRTPYPIILVMGGLAISLLRNLPRISLNPDVIFLVFLPPLLFTAAFHASWRDFRSNLAGISLLAFGLVGFTAGALAYASSWLLPGFDHRLGFVLGALVASTDAIAASAIAKRMGLPKRIIDLLEGESLVNDATSLVALEFSIAMLVSNRVPTIGAAVLRLVYLASVGVLVGLLAGRLIHWCQSRLNDAPIEITLALMAPYLSYIAAESLHASGVLATVTCGLYLGHNRSQSLSMKARLESVAVLNTLDFVLNGLVFILIGLQLPQILAGIRNLPFSSLILDGALLTAALVVLRMTWVFAESWISRAVRRLIKRPQPHAPSQELFILGWTGMRGVIALAAAISLPDVLDNGAAFPQRDLLIFLTFFVILITLVAQGLSLPFLIRKLGLTVANSANSEEREARVQMLSAAMKQIGDMRGEGDAGNESIFDDLLHHYQQRLDEANEAPEAVARVGADFGKYRNITAQLRAVERSTLLRMRDEYKINDEVLRTLEQELDLLDTRYHLSPAGPRPCRGNTSSSSLRT